VSESEAIRKIRDAAHALHVARYLLESTEDARLAEAIHSVQVLTEQLEAFTTRPQPRLALREAS
jgi:hypothetical protein